jgi:8-oxo-dGTP pyrophosphatase MutT (NUDIX family)
MSSVPQYNIDVTIDVTIHKPFGNLYRSQHVLILPILPDAKLLLARKSRYPLNLYRCVGGGVEESETPEAAAVRELAEEASILIGKYRLKKLAEVVTTAQDVHNNYYQFTTYIFTTLINDQQAKVNSDVDELKIFTLEDLKQLVQTYAQIPEDSWNQDPDPKFVFCWRDYAKVYGPMHEIIYNDLCNTTLN